MPCAAGSNDGNHGWQGLFHITVVFNEWGRVAFVDTA
jgi:hypothetical protein